MAGTNQSEQIEALTRLMVAMHRRAQGLRPSILRFQRGALTQRELGQLCGVSADTIHAWEKGTQEPTTGQALAWMTALHSRGGRAPADG